MSEGPRVHASGYRADPAEMAAAPPSLEHRAAPSTVTDPTEQPTAAAAEYFTDTFAGLTPPGRVIGSAVRDGIRRKGVDKERVIGIDNGALRIQPLTKSRWGRAGVAYGPYARRCGLAFGVSMLNGHNTSQTGALPDTLRQRLTQWTRGSETDRPLKRLARWLRSRQRKYFWRHLRQWAISGSRYLQTVVVNENLAVGWFPREAPQNPLEEGDALLMHALGPECGELWARVGSGALPSVRGIQNVHLYYLVVLRDQGAAYYAASIPGVPGFQPYPTMTPLAIDPFNADSTVYAGVHQSVLGQIGFRVDTRVYRTQVALLPEYRQWFGSAAGADRLTGDDKLDERPAEIGGAWKAWDGGLRRTSKGLVGVGPSNAAVLELPEPAGLLHVVVDTDDRPVEGVSLLFRVKDRDNFWAFEVGTRQCALLVMQGGTLSRFPASAAHYLAPNAANSVQIADDGATIRLYVNNDLVYNTHFKDSRLHDGRGVGLQRIGPVAHGTLRDFEAHPRCIPLPRPLDLGAPWTLQGTRVVAQDDFRGAPVDLAGRPTPGRAHTWRRLVGTGEIRLTGDGAAKVVGTVQTPCPGRTAYTIPWDQARFADVTVQITPPGTKRGQGERGRGGLIFWQDERNYITLSIFADDWYGMSIAAFFYRDGYEELYDAVWSNIGKRVYWGMPYVFRVVFDANRYTAYLNDEPVLQRALRDIYPDWEELPIRQVGIVANWEWGNDTGSIFRDFVARDRG